MQKNDLNKKKISEELGIDFDEAVELFSEETLNSMKMKNVIGGTSELRTNIECVIINKGDKCKFKNISCSY